MRFFFVCISTHQVKFTKILLNVENSIYWLMQALYIDEVKPF